MFIRFEWRAHEVLVKWITVLSSDIGISIVGIWQRYLHDANETYTDEMVSLYWNRLLAIIQYHVNIIKLSFR